MGSWCGGGGSSGPQTVNQSTSNIPAYLQPYVEKMIGQATALTTNTNYPQYQGQRVAGFNPMQQGAYNDINSMKPSALTDQAAGLAGMAGTSQFTGQGMSPYIQNVVNQQTQQAIRDYGMQLPGMSAVATGAGGLGGSRQALVQANAQQGLQNQLANISATGYQNAYENARNQFNIQNQNMLAASGMLGNLGQMDYTQRMGIDNAKLAAGAQQRGVEQDLLNTQYQDYMNALNYPYQQLGFLNSLMHGYKQDNFGTANYAAPGNIYAQGLGALGLGGTSNG